MATHKYNAISCLGPSRTARTAHAQWQMVRTARDTNFAGHARMFYCIKRKACISCETELIGHIYLTSLYILIVMLLLKLCS